jgi:pimeloyl-ACP methyl ester carboxylesterase
MIRRRRTRAFRDANGEIVAGSIAEVAYPTLGGVRQYVLIRGENVSNPPLIVLHGGPGFSDTTFMRHFNASLEKKFTVVYWDQRGTGKSYSRKIPRSSMTVERFVADLDELVDFVRGRTGASQVILFGHSWGSVLGPLYASRFPAKVSAYVASGQMSSWLQGESLSYAYAVAEAERQDDHKTLAKLRAIGPPPYAAASMWVERFAVNRLDGMLRPRTMLGLARLFLTAPESSVFDLRKMLQGFRFSIDATWDEVSKVDLLHAVPALEMAVFFFIGRNDHWVPPEASVTYFNALQAPLKRLVFFEDSGHEPFVDEPAKFSAQKNVPRTDAVANDRVSRSKW